MIPAAWPFSTWGLDIIGPLWQAPGGFDHVFVAIDKFSKWIEAKPVGKITSRKAIEFVHDIFTRFGIPRRIITDHGGQFTSKEFKAFAAELGIEVAYSSVAHPQSNGQVERANGCILHGLRTRIFDRLKPHAGKWAAEFPSVLWGLRTTVSRATGQTPFSLVYGSQAMMPSEVLFSSPRVEHFDEDASDDARVIDLIQAEHRREQAALS